MTENDNQFARIAAPMQRIVLGPEPKSNRNRRLRQNGIRVQVPYPPFAYGE